MSDDTVVYINAQIARGALRHCPAGCLVEKIDGCNYIECACGVKFCWNCGKTKGPEGCKYGAAECNSH